jgi:hypothetical protein
VASIARVPELEVVTLPTSWLSAPANTVEGAGHLIAAAALISILRRRDAGRLSRVLETVIGEARMSLTSRTASMAQEWLNDLGVK